MADCNAFLGSDGLSAITPKTSGPSISTASPSKGESIPIVLLPTAFAHGIKAEHRPIGKVRIEAVSQVFVHAGAEFFDRTIDLVRGLFCGQTPPIFFLRGGVFTTLGQRIKAEHRR